MLGTLVFNFKQHRASGIPVKNQVLIIIAAIVITIPSLISASTLVKQTYNETQLTSFIDNELPGLYVVNKQFEDKKIKLVVIGDDLNKSEISSLDNRLSDYQLGDYKLQFQQLSKGNYLSVNAFKKYVDQEKSSTTQTTTSSSDKNLLKLKSQIIKEYPDAVEKVYIGQLVEKNKSDKALILVKLKDDTPDNQTTVKKFVKTSADKLNIDYSLHFTKD